jgi:hypothetical protein
MIEGSFVASHSNQTSLTPTNTNTVSFTARADTVGTVTFHASVYSNQYTPVVTTSSAVEITSE